MNIGNISIGNDADSDNEDNPTPVGSPSKQKILDTKENADGEGGPKVVEEATKSGGVKWSLYWKYFMAGSGCFAFFLLLLFNALTQVLFTGADWWLNFW